MMMALDALLHPACVLFDLDGTLLDTAPDMGRALNQLLQECGKAELPSARIRPVVSHGTLGLLDLGFGLSPSDTEFSQLRLRYLDLYKDILAVETVLFAGMAEVLETLEQRGLRWGIVTNKPGWLSEPLLDQLGLLARAATVVSGDTLTVRKPDPAPLLYACQQVGVAPAACIYVGDAERDIEAGRRAGMGTLVARYGYLHAQERPESWGADGLIDAPLELLDWLG